MIKINLQFFGGRGGGGSGGARGGGRAGGGGGAPEKVTASTWNGAVEALEAQGFKVDSVNRRSPDSIIALYDNNGMEYTATVNQYFRGDYEVINIKPTGNRQSPSEAPIGTKWTMGGYTYTKNKSGTWTTYKDGKRYPNRTNADIKRVFT
jgi:hypothetical protein